MTEYRAKVKFVDIREVTISADNKDEAQRKFDAGEWDDETTVDFYSDEILSPLEKVDE